MRRKGKKLMLLLSVLSGGGCLFCFGENTIRYTQCMMDSQRCQEIIAGREENRFLLNSLVFEGEELFFDQNSGTLYYSVIEGEPAALDPGILLDSEYEGAEFAFLGPGLTEELIRDAQETEILVYTPEYYYVYQLVCTTLPLMNIDCPAEFEEEPVEMEITVFDNRRQAAERVKTSKGQIHIRGGSTRYISKRSYRLSLTEENPAGTVEKKDISLLGLRRDDDWILYSAYTDQEKIRNVFSSNLWEYTCAQDNEKHVNAGTEYRYLELFMNHEYRGLYALGYPVDRKQFGISEDAEKEALYKKVTWDSERDLQLLEDGNLSGYKQKGIADESESAESGLLLEYYDALYRNRGNTEELYKGIDLDNAVDFYLFLNLIQGTDHVYRDLIKNMYLAVYKEADGLKGLYAPWDMDLTWGNVYTDDWGQNLTVPYQLSSEHNMILENGYLDQIILNQDSEIWEYILGKYWELRKDKWSDESINALISQYESEIFDSGAFVRDMNRWPEGAYTNPENRLNVFRRYVTERLEEMDLYCRRMEAACRENTYIRRCAQYKDFEEHFFLIEIYNHELLADPDYEELFAYLQLDLDRITEEIHFIIAKPSEKKADYLSALGVGDMADTVLGIVSLERDEDRNYSSENDYTVKLNGIKCYDVIPEKNQEIRMALLKDDVAEEFNFSGNYERICGN